MARRRSQGPGPTLLLCFGVACVLMLLQPDALAAHGELRKASPSNGAHLSVVPTELRLTFTEPVELALARITLLGPAGAVELRQLELHPDSANVLIVPITGALPAGTYEVGWRVAGADGHPVRGRYSFVIAPGAAGLALPPAPGQPPAPVTHHEAASFPEGPGFDAESPLYAAIRWLTFVALLGVCGAVAFRLVLLLAARQHNPACDTILKPAARRAAYIGVWSSAALLFAAVLRLVAQSTALHGVANAFAPGLVGTLLTRTLWGWGWLLQVGASLAAMIAFRRAVQSHTGAWLAAAAAAVVLAFTPGLAGHAAATTGLGPLPLISDALHVVGAGGWLGGLLGVLLAGVPLALRLPAEQRGSATATLVNAFSPTALTFAGLTVATGILGAWIHIGSPTVLFTSGYGRILLLKLVVLTGVFATGAYNWLRVRPALGDAAAAGRLRRSSTVELTVGLLVLVVTAVLVATPPPTPKAAPTAADCCAPLAETDGEDPPATTP